MIYSVLALEDEKFLQYYRDELSYLRNAGQLFAKKYPKIARRLDFNEKESNDPHTERLLESFAFMAARLHQKVDDRFPEIATALLDVLYPHLTSPIPSMGIAQFQWDLIKKSAVGYTIPSRTHLSSEAEEGMLCRFQTVYPTTLWPIVLKSVQVVSASFHPTLKASSHGWFLHFSFAIQQLDFLDLGINELTFHIRGDRVLSLLLYESIFAQNNQETYIKCQERIEKLAEGSLYPLGFEESELALPPPLYTTHVYALLQEYFHFPEKFLFFNIRNLKSFQSQGADSHFDIFISIRGGDQLLSAVISPDNFLMGCTPIVNIFKRSTDPFRLTHRQHQYRLIPDQRRDRTTEIYSIQSLRCVMGGNVESKPLPPYFTFQRETAHTNTTYWAAQRVSAHERNVPGSDMLISFVDRQLNPSVPPDGVIFAETLCTNRFLATQLMRGTELQSDFAAPVQKILCIDRPCLPSYSPSDGDALWKLISHLSTNYLGFASHDCGLALLKEMFMVFKPSHAEGLDEIDRFQAFSTEPIVRRFGSEAWRGFVKGLEVSLFFDRGAYSGSSCFLLATILRYYFAGHIVANHFVEIVLKDSATSREWMRWAPLPGIKTLL